MRIKDYLKDKLLMIIMFLSSIIFLILVLELYKMNRSITFLISLVFIINYILIIVYDFSKRKSFYYSFEKTLLKLDKKYLITEMIKNSDFEDGKKLLNYLSEINKTMHEEINDYKYINEEFREYIELWCHEIKTPIATSKLIIENNKNAINKSILEEIDKIELYVEQVLYYSKIGTLEKDYIISSTNLLKVVEKVIKRNKKDLINKSIKINIDFKNIYVQSDSKWLEFIINQIIINSIKYSKSNNSYINISIEENKNNIKVIIEDNGIGINKDEINKVFEKGYTGSNGRKKYNSTGIGLYLCKKLCVKLDHNITIYSEENIKTIVNITFPNNSMTSIID